METMADIIDAQLNVYNTLGWGSGNTFDIFSEKPKPHTGVKAMKHRKDEILNDDRYECSEETKRKMRWLAIQTETKILIKKIMNKRAK